MSTHKNLITLCFATVFALGLAACGGGGGDAPVASMMDGDDTDDTMTSSLVGKVIPSGAMFTLPEGLVDDITVSDVAQDASVPVPGVGTFKCVAGPCTVVVADNVVRTTGDIEVESLADDLPAEVLMALADAIPSEPAGPTPEQQTAAAATKAEAIDVIVAADGLGGDAATTAAGGAGSYNLSVERDADGTTVTVSVQEGATANADEDEKFEQAEDLGGGLTKHTRDGEDGVQEIAMVMTDIEAPEATAFGMVYDLNADEDGENDTSEDAVGLTVVAGTGDVNLPLIMAADFAPGSGSSTQLSFDFAQDDGDPDMDGDQPVAAAEVDGTYDGAMGTYTCTGDALCTVTVNSDGEVTAINGEWTFFPRTGPPPTWRTKTT